MGDAEDGHSSGLEPIIQLGEFLKLSPALQAIGLQEVNHHGLRLGFDTGLLQNELAGARRELRASTIDGRKRDGGNSTPRWGTPRTPRRSKTESTTAQGLAGIRIQVFHARVSCFFSAHARQSRERKPAATARTR